MCVCMCVCVCECVCVRICVVLSAFVFCVSVRFLSVCFYVCEHRTKDLPVTKKKKKAIDVLARALLPNLLPLTFFGVFDHLALAVTQFRLRKSGLCFSVENDPDFLFEFEYVILRLW